MTDRRRGMFEPRTHHTHFTPSRTRISIMFYLMTHAVGFAHNLCLCANRVCGHFCSRFINCLTPTILLNDRIRHAATRKRGSLEEEGRGKRIIRRTVCLSSRRQDASDQRLSLFPYVSFTLSHLSFYFPPENQMTHSSLPV